jgi:hypothetical protein
MSTKQFKCPVCGRDAKEIGFRCEQVMLPQGMSPADLKRKPPFGELQREFWVECPEHGLNIDHTIGHHVSTIPK